MLYLAQRAHSLEVLPTAAASTELRNKLRAGEAAKRRLLAGTRGLVIKLATQFLNQACALRRVPYLPQCCPFAASCIALVFGIACDLTKPQVGAFRWSIFIDADKSCSAWSIPWGKGLSIPSGQRLVHPFGAKAVGKREAPLAHLGANLDVISRDV
jgi:hypothetical protein